MSKEALTIVIPTRNRTRYLERLLAYYASTACPYRLVIGDSSDTDPLQRTAELIRRFSKELVVEHRPYPPRPHLPPGQDGIECVADMLTHVQTPYAIYMADDDFIVTGAIGKGIRFLESHPEYSAVNGQAILVGLKREGDALRVAGASDYLQRGFEAPRAAERVRDHLVRHGATEFSVKRTPQIRESFQAVVRLGLNNLFEENFVNCMTLINGKVKKLDDLYMVRQGHAGQTSANSLTMFDWVVSPQFSEQFYRFLDYLSEKLAQKDAVALSEARQIIREGFWFYIADGLKRRWEVYSRPTEQKWLKRMRLKTRKSDWARAGWVALRSRIPDQKGRMLLPALLRPSSPYYADFKPIYSLITAST